MHDTGCRIQEASRKIRDPIKFFILQLTSGISDNCFMISAGSALSKIPIADQAARCAARQALENAGLNQAHTALFFATSDYKKNYARISSEIKKITGASQIIGTSASGILTEQEEVERQPALCVMLLGGTALDVQGFLTSDLQESNFRAGENTARFLKESGIAAKLMLLFPDPFSFQSGAFFQGVEQNYGYIPILGAASAEDGKEEKTYQIENDRVFCDSAAGLALGGNFRFETGITRSCQPFGEALRVTRAEGSMIYEIEGRPAYDVLLESLSKIEFDHPDQLFQRVFLGMPTRSFQTEFHHNFLIRNIMGVNTKKGLLSTVSPVEEGEFLTFTVRDPHLAHTDLERMLQDLQAQLGEEKPAFGFYFNCCARGQLLYGEPSHDIQVIRQAFPGVPIAGFSGYGEMAPLDHTNLLHQHCGVLTLIS